MLAVIGAVALAAGCSVKDTPTPDLTGPSELSLTLSMSALPDTINQDGSSQALVVVIARDGAGSAKVGLSIRLDVEKYDEAKNEWVIGDYGVLSAKTVTTDGDGRASAVYTAPAPPANSSELGTVRVRVRATAIGTNYASTEPRSVEIRLMPPGVVLPPELGPVATFAVDGVVSDPIPTKKPNVAVGFDASASSSPAGLTSYVWDFGDGASGSGVGAQHTFSTGGTYAVRLTVTDKNGKTAWKTRFVTVAAGPTALFVWGPLSPSTVDTVRFNGSDSWAVPPARISTWAWTFLPSSCNLQPLGPSDATDGSVVKCVFSSAGKYSVTLTVTDTSGLVGQVTQTVTVK